MTVLQAVKQWKRLAVYLSNKKLSVGWENKKYRYILICMTKKTGHFSLIGKAAAVFFQQRMNNNLSISIKSNETYIEKIVFGK